MMEFNSLRPIKIPKAGRSILVLPLCFAVAAAIIVKSESEAAAEEAAPLHRDLKKELLSQVPKLQLLGNIIEGTLEHRRSERFAVPITEPGCYVIAAVGENTVEDLSLAVLQSGVEKANDRLSKKKPLVKWCASQGGGVEAEVLMFKGRGAFALAVFSDKVDSSSGKPGEKAFDKPNSGSLKTGGSESDFIANRIRQLYPQFGKNRHPITEVLRGNLAKDALQQFSIPADGKCLSIIAAQESSLLKIDVTLKDGSRTLPFNQQSMAGFFVAETAPCLDSGSNPVLSIRAKEGQGRFGIQVFSE